MDISAYTVYTKFEILEDIQEHGGRAIFLGSLMQEGTVKQLPSANGITLYYLSDPVDLECKVKEWSASEMENSK